MLIPNFEFYPVFERSKRNFLKAANFVKVRPRK